MYAGAKTRCPDELKASFVGKSEFQTLVTNPENGLLSGEIVELIRSDEFVIRDFSEKRWNILGNDVIWKSDVNKELGERVKVMGVFSGENNFIAKEVRPWSCQCNECKEMDSERTCLGNNQAGKSHSCSK